MDNTSNTSQATTNPLATVTQDPEKEVLEYKKFVIFELDSEEYAAPVEVVIEVLKSAQITSVPSSEEYIRGIINNRGDIVPIIDFEKRLGLKREATTALDHLMIVEINNVHFGFGVDKVTEVINIPVNKIKPTPKLVESKVDAKFLSGVVVLEGKKRSEKEVENEQKSDSVANVSVQPSIQRTLATATGLGKAVTNPDLISTAEQVPNSVSATIEGPQNQTPVAAANQVVISPEKQNPGKRNPDLQGSEKSSRVILIINVEDIFNTQQIEQIDQVTAQQPSVKPTAIAQDQNNNNQLAPNVAPTQEGTLS